MFFDYGSYEYYIRPGFTDMRCGSDSLARTAMEETGGEVYVSDHVNLLVDLRGR